MPIHGHGKGPVSCTGARATRLSASLARVFPPIEAEVQMGECCQCDHVANSQYPMVGVVGDTLSMEHDKWSVGLNLAGARPRRVRADVSWERPSQEG